MDDSVRPPDTPLVPPSADRTDGRYLREDQRRRWRRGDRVRVEAHLAGPAEMDRFRREAAATARLQHPNVVQLFEVGEVAGRPYFALEYVEGGTLAGRLTRGPVEPRPAADLVRTLAAAVEHAHTRGV